MWNRNTMIDSEGREFGFNFKFIAVHTLTVYIGNTLSQKPQEGKKGQQWEKREALFAVAAWPVQ